MAEYYGQFETDKLIEMYCPGHCGFCVEVGAGDGVRGSNTAHFERNKGWRALCIEPNNELFETCRKLRPLTLRCACGETERIDTLAVYDIGERKIQTSCSSLRPDTRLVDQHRRLINNTWDQPVRVFKLDTLLRLAGFPVEINFISIDTEGTELEVLKGLSLDKWKIRLLVVENNFNDTDVEEYLHDFGYVKDARYKINDFYLKEENCET
jgi:FkbM family methyltransferase